MLRRRRSPAQRVADAVPAAIPAPAGNPGVPVAGALGFTLLGAALMRRRAAKRATRAR